jgi:SAM-dependent methyltransferase
VTTNAEQAAHWNDESQSGHWVIQQARYDAMLAPFADLILEAAALQRGERVLDVGCGCGATTLSAAQLVAPGLVTGVDLSAPMLARAEHDATHAGIQNVAFIQGDAQVHFFEECCFDAVISRFGLMFFEDPVAAFVNLHGATRPGGRLTFVCWQPLLANQWLVVPGAAVLEHIGQLPEGGEADAPGMFALADPERTRSLLASAGWLDVTCNSAHVPMLVGGGGTLDDSVEFLRAGSIGRTLLANLDAETEGRAVAAVRQALSSHVDSDGVRLDAAVWVVQATARAE